MDALERSLRIQNGMYLVRMWYRCGYKLEDLWLMLRHNNFSLDLVREIRERLEEEGEICAYNSFDLN